MIWFLFSWSPFNNKHSLHLNVNSLNLRLGDASIIDIPTCLWREKCKRIRFEAKTLLLRSFRGQFALKTTFLGIHFCQKLFLLFIYFAPCSESCAKYPNMLRTSLVNCLTSMSMRNNIIKTWRVELVYFLFFSE